MIEVNGIKLYSSKELQEMLGVSSYTITKYRNLGLLPYTNVGRARYTSEEALKDYLNGKTRQYKTNK